jgi:hypothetical protein
MTVFQVSFLQFIPAAVFTACRYECWFDDVTCKLLEAITLASKHIKVCHAGLDPASSLFSGFRLSQA